MDRYNGKKFIGALKNKFGTDIFTAARLKIVLLYLLMGIVILGVAGYLVYTHILSIIQNVIQLIQQLLQSNATVNQGTAATLIAKAINAEIAKMNLTIGLWLIVTMVILAYLFADITLWPIERAMEKQRRFIGNVSHELRTPISVMKTNSEVTLLAADALTRDELVTALMSNLEEIERMSKITQFLLNFSTLDNRLAKLEMMPVELGAIVLKAGQSMTAAASEKHVTLTTTAEKNMMVRGNAIALEEMVVNLVKNAIAYTPTEGSVRLSVSARADGIVLTAEDTGIGIEEADLKNIFEPFYRGENAKNNQKKDVNAGLGLAIVHEIALMHRAAITVQSHIGQGTTFFITFPPLAQPKQNWIPSSTS